MRKMVNPEGTKDLNFLESERKQRLISAINKKLYNWGYRKISTPTLEYFETFSRTLPIEDTENFYKLISTEAEILTLRSDMTIPIARMVSSKFKNSKEILRFQYTEDVYNIKKKQSGHFNELTDCGAELIGCGSQEEDLEILTMALEIGSLFEDYNFILELGDRHFFQGMCKHLNLDREVTNRLARLVAEKNLPSLENYVKELGFSKEVQEFFIELPWATGGREVLEKWSKYDFNEELVHAIEYLDYLYTELSDLGYEDSIGIDLSKIPKLDYYTSIIFEGFVDTLGTPVLSGGRYDRLIEKFQDTRRPAIGFSVKVDYLLKLDIFGSSQPIKTLYYPRGEFNRAYKYAKDYRKEEPLILQVGDVEDLTLVEEDGDA